MDRYFEKISFTQFSNDITNDKKLYDSYELPRRGSTNSCGYDFIAINNYVIKPHEIVKIPTGYKAKFLGDEVLLLLGLQMRRSKHQMVTSISALQAPNLGSWTGI